MQEESVQIEKEADVDKKVVASSPIVETLENEEGSSLGALKEKAIKSETEEEKDD